MNPEDMRTAHAAQVPTSYKEQYHGYIRHKRLIIFLFALLLLILVIVSITLGTADLSPLDVLAALVGQGSVHDLIVVWNLRMPRVLTAIVGGIALALAGCAFQSVLRNPLASASTLGISQGAAFGASIAIIVLGMGSSAAAYEGLGTSNPYLTVICAFAGAIASTLIILALSRFRDMTPESIVLAGVALSALFTARPPSSNISRRIRRSPPSCSGPLATSGARPIAKSRSWPSSRWRHSPSSTSTAGASTPWNPARVPRMDSGSTSSERVCST